jgi:tetratricopeptide (TPR) repeat protein
MQKIVLFCSALIFSLQLYSQTAEELVKQGDLLEKQMNEEAAYQKFKEVVKLQPQNVYALARCSELASRIGRQQLSKDKQMDYYTAAKIYAERALKANPNDSDANMVMAVAYGRFAILKSGKEKVAGVKEIKNYAEKAVQLNPKNYKALHILGKWHYEVSNLTSIERAAAKVLFGGLPKASFEASLSYYEKAKALSPGFILNYLEIAKVSYKLNKKEKALETLRYLLQLPNATSEDALVKTEAKQLIEKWK